MQRAGFPERMLEPEVGHEFPERVCRDDLVVRFHEADALLHREAATEWSRLVACVA